MAETNLGPYKNKKTDEITMKRRDEGAADRNRQIFTFKPHFRIG